MTVGDPVVEIDVAGDPALAAAFGDVEQARRRLDFFGPAANTVAHHHLQTAIDRLRPLAADDDVPRVVRMVAERWRASLSSHLLAARDVQAAGATPATVTKLLRRATDVVLDLTDQLSA